MSTEHPGIYINMVIAVGGAVWVLISSLIVYIWRTSILQTRKQFIIVDERVSALERSGGLAVSKLIENPILSVTAHTALCGKNTSDVTNQFNNSLESSVRLISQRIDLMEVNIGLRIEKAILEAARNGK